MFEKIAENLTALGYKVSCFESAEAAAKYIDGELDGRTVGIGGSMTVEQMGLYPLLCTHNDVYWHWKSKESDVLSRAADAEVYISSVNGIAETGEIINIDGNCNRIASTLYGHKKVYFVVGQNKIAPDYDSALLRARNVAAPLNAKRIGTLTPCTLDGVCHNCKSPERICRGLSVLWSKPMKGEFEIILIAEDLGY